MTRKSFRRDLETLREDVVAMGELARRQFDDAANALEAHDERLATEVIARDETLKWLYLDLEGDCIDLLSLQQPVAIDLRFVVASFKISTDLERVGDLATNLGQHVPPRKRPALPEVNVQDIAAIADEMLRTAIEAYETSDSGLCHRVADQDDELDGLCERVTDLLIRSLVSADARTDVESLWRAATDLLLVVRDLERVGDHAVNIAARTLCAVESTDVLLY